MKFLKLGLMLAFTLGTLGCGGDDTPELGQVSGTVTNAGVPVAGSLVEFVPENGRPSMGRTDETGHFVLTYTPDNPGAKVGAHAVRISPGSMVPPPTSEDANAKPLPPMPKPKPGEDVVNMPGKVEVEPEDNVFDFDLATVK